MEKIRNSYFTFESHKCFRKSKMFQILNKTSYTDKYFKMFFYLFVTVCIMVFSWTKMEK